MKYKQWTSQALILSVATNIGLICSLVYLAAQRDFSDNQVTHSTELAESRILYVSSSSVEVLSDFFRMSFQQLFEYLADDTLVEEGYRKRDYALACLVSYHHFDIERALSGTELQKRSVEFIHTDGGERIKIILFPGIDDQQFEAIEYFGKTEKWPLTNQGLFFALQESKRQGSLPKSLKETFFLTPEFNTVWTVFNGTENLLGLDEILNFMLQSDWKYLRAFHENCLQRHEYSKEVQREFLLHLIEQKSKLAAKFLIEKDLNFVVDKLDDARVIYLLSLIDLETENALGFAKNLVTSLRSDAVHKSAAIKLYELSERAVPSVLSMAKVYEDFGLIAKKAPESKLKNVAKKIHVVSKGDSLWKVAKVYGVDINELKKVNGLVTSPLIKPGMKLVIPSRERQK